MMRENVQDVYKLSPVQRGILFHTLKEPESAAYHDQFLLPLEQSLDPETFRRAWQSTVDHTPVLRTLFLWDQLEEPVQVVTRTARVPFEVEDLSDRPPDAQKERVRQYLEEDRRRGFDLTRAPLTRVRLFRLAPESHRLVWSYHHLLLDGWSAGLVIREVIERYRAAAGGDEADLPARRSFKEFIAWLRSRDAQAGAGYWRDALAGAPAPTLPAAARPPGEAPGDFEKLRDRLSRHETDALEAFARKLRVTLPTLVTAAWGVTLARLSGEDRPLFGITLSGRPPSLSGVDSMVGCFINTLPFSLEIPWHEPLEAWLPRVQKAQQELQKHQADSLVEVRKIAGIPADRPPFEAILVFESFGAASVGRSGEYESFQRTNYPLTVGAMPLEAGLSLAVGLDVERIDPADGRRILDLFRQVLTALPGSADRPVRALPSAPAAERARVLEDFSGAARAQDAGEAPAALLHDLVTRAARRHGDEPAVVAGEAELTYGELLARSDALARRLAGLGVGPETVVGICLERSFDLLVAVFGVLRAGAAYLPLDPSYPEDRLAFMVEDSATPVILTREDLESLLPEGPRRLHLEDAPDREDLAEAEPAAPDPAHPAYVIYTSGSTGRPKGVVVPHAAVAHRIRSQATEELSPETRFLQKTSLSFDVSVAEIFAPLAAGGRTVLARSGGEKDADYLAQCIPEAGITHTSFPPTLLSLLLENDTFVAYDGLQVVATGGETVPADLPERFFARFPDTELENRYGPTEATISVTRWRCRRGVAERVLPIGTPIADARIFLVDRRLDPVPVGVPGEILLGGPCLARGYLKRPGRTAEAFVPHPFASRSGERVYRSGDLARWRSDGALEFVGRVDRQVKIRGFRVELGEVETALRRQEGVQEGVVVDLPEERTGTRRLVAYVVAEPETTVSERGLVEFLGETLPDYMVPSAVVFVDAIPLGPTGKVDRDELPAPFWESEEFVPPATPVEEIVAHLWSDVLEVERVGATDDFFDLGGHSLLVTKVLSRVRDTFGVELPLKALFEASTVRGLAEAVEVERRREEATAGAQAPPLEPVPRDGGGLPLSFAQERLWFLDRLQPGAVHYNIPAVLRLSGDLRLPAFVQALTEVVRRHESLRTTFGREGGRPVQRVGAPWSVPMPWVDLSRLSILERHDENLRLLREAVVRPFDLEAGPLLTVRDLTWDGTEHDLVLMLHHVVADAWSAGVLVEETGALYRAALEGRPSPLPEPALQYADYAAWQRSWLTGEVLQTQLDYWRERLEGAPGALDLPTDRPRPPVETFRGHTRFRQLPLPTSTALGRLARESGATLFMTGLAAFFAHLGRLSGQSEILVGTPIANRGRTETESTIGLFLNTLVLRGRVGDDPTFRQLLERVREETLGAYAHQDVPFEALVRELEPERNLARSPFFQVMFVLQTADEGAKLDLPGLEPRPTMIPSETAKFDLTLQVHERSEGLMLSLEYNRDLFDRTTIERWLAQLDRMVTAVAEDPETTLSALPWMGSAERHQVLAEWSDTTRKPPREPLPALLRARAEAMPERPALAFRNEELTYGELFQRVGALARRLAGRGVGPETRVGILLERSVDMVVAVLAAMEAGGAYVPLDPSHPRARLAYVAADAGISVLVTRGDRDASEIAPGVPVLRMDADDGPRAEPIPPGLQHLVYVLYTSGSTGRPKGVEIPHGALVNFLASMARRPGLGEDDVLLAVTTLGFDIAGLELYLPLLVGARLVVAPAETVGDGPALLELLTTSGATVLQATPATWRLLLASGWTDGSGLKALCGGEALPRELAQQVLDTGAELWNLYGPTETTIWSSTARVGTGAGPVSLGRPIANTRVLTLDRRGEPSPVAVPGELVIGGAGLARGYHGLPARTAAVFVPHPWGGAGERLYRTGDLARFRPDGALEYLGRLDHQVKVRGFRIELAEIESVLEEHPAVAQAAVVAREEATGDPRLVAWVVGTAEPVPDLRPFLAERLPPYMVPSRFETLDALPLTPNDKVDRRALMERPLGAAEAAEPVRPASSAEKAVAEIWQDVLGLDAVGVEESFFDLGGHSLLLIDVQHRLEERFDRPVEVADLFRHPTIRRLARFLTGPDAATGAAGATRARRRSGVPESTEIAIVGMAGRFPGAADLAALWELLRDGREGVTFYDDEELLAAGVPEDALADPSYVKARGDVEGRDLFDAAFFGYAPREAQILDPQQRLFLEHAWEALERSGHDAERFPGRVGVFAGMGLNTYLLHLVARPDLMAALGRFQTVIANDKDFLPTRVAYKMGLTGPAINVQTACSTSLVAVALGCESLLTGRSDMVLAGGVTLHTGPPSGYRFEEEGIASPDGHTRTFDAAGRGTVASSGVGVVVLKRLEDAQADGDTIHAVLKGFALNNDGALKVGFTAPGVEGQAAAIAEAWEAAGLDPATAGYVEAHGTATPLGDPVELSALRQVFGDARGPGSVAVGSIKSNLGHTDAAAGVAGLIKAVLALEHGRIPPSLYFEEPNPRIDFGPFRVPTELEPWEPVDGIPRRAGVSSFGIGGTNAHVVVEEAPAPEPSSPPRDAELLVVSARTRTALDAATENLGRHLAERPEAHLGDVAFTLQAGRKVFPYRRFLVATGPADAASALTPLDGERVHSAHSQAKDRPVVFLFSGGGAQYPAMGRDLYETEPVFRREMDRCDEILRDHVDFPLVDLLYGPEADAEETREKLRRTSYALPALCAVEVALARLWTSWGLAPAAVLGHSLGEYSAASVAGVLSLEDALALVALRGKLFETLPAGSMLSVSSSPQEIEPRLSDELSIAAVNTPELCAVSGPTEAVEALARELEAEGVEASLIHIDVAAHSPMVEPILEPFAEAVRGIEPGAPKIPYLSNVTGTWRTAEDAARGDYWPRHLRHTVRFAEGLSTLFADLDDAVLLEVGPGQTLATLARQHPERPEGTRVVSSLRHPRDEVSDVAFLMGALGRLWLAGATVDWPRHHGEARRRRVELPTYPFERQSYWVEARPFEAGLEAPSGTGDLLPATAEAESVDAGDEAPLDHEPPRTETERRIAAVWSSILGVSRIGVHDDFFELGGSSLLAVRLGSALRRELGRELSPHFLLEAPTVAQLAELLGDEGEAAGIEAPTEDGGAPEAATPESLLVPLQTGNGRTPLFLVHPVGGHVYFYQRLARELHRDLPVFGVRARGAAAGEEPCEDLPVMARRYVEDLKRIAPEGPYRLGGSSMGGLVAYEMAQQLVAAGDRVELLALLDTAAPADMVKVPRDDAELLDYLLRGRLPMPLEELRRRPPEEQLGLVLDHARESGALPPDLDLEGARRLVTMVKAHLKALAAYEPEPYPGRLLFFRAEERREWDAPWPERAWIDLARGGIEIHVVPGDHITMHHPPHLETLSGAFRKSLKAS